MKFKIHVPTVSFGFVETEVDKTAEEAVEISNELLRLVEPKVGVERKDFNEYIDSYLTDGSIDADTYALMSNGQKLVIQELKKAFKRINKE